MTTIDKDALKQKYAQERAKRLRPDGNDQYLQVKDQLAHYLEDPYTPVAERAPITDHVQVAFIGGGFAGLVTGARLKEAGVEDVRTIEKGGEPPLAARMFSGPSISRTSFAIVSRSFTPGTNRQSAPAAR